MTNDKQREDFLMYRTGGFDMDADFDLWQAAQAVKQQEIDRLKAENERLSARVVALQAQSDKYFESLLEAQVTASQISMMYCRKPCPDYEPLKSWLDNKLVEAKLEVLEEFKELYWNAIGKQDGANLPCEIASRMAAGLKG